MPLAEEAKRGVGPATSMSRMVLVLALLIPFAGCLGDDADPAVLDDVDDSTAAATMHFADTVDVRVTATRPSFIVVGGVQPANCFAVEGASEIVNGTVTATWSAMTPATQTMELRVAGAESVFVEGASPLTLDVQDVKPEDGRILIMMQPAMPGAAVEQQVSVEMDLHYLGGGMKTDPNWVCSHS